MNLSKLSMVFLIVFTAAVAPLLWATQVTSTASLVSEETRGSLTTASYDTAKSLEIVDNYAFKTTSQRNEALDTFYTSLASAYGLSATGGAVHVETTSHIPFVALIDNDGVYVCYSKDYNNWGKLNSTAYKITPITTYSTGYTVSSDVHYQVQFTLNGEATVFLNGTKMATGTYKEVLRELTDRRDNNKPGKDALNILKFMNSQEDFDEEKQIVVTNVIVRSVENYMNKEIASNKKNQVYSKTGWNLHNTQYKVVIPRDQQSDFANALSAPTVMSFYQGKQMQIGDTYTMSVALAGGEIGPEERYYVEYRTDRVEYDEHGAAHAVFDIYYHSDKNCPLILNATIRQRDADSGEYISDNKTYTMEEAASLGAYPCPECVH